MFFTGDGLVLFDKINWWKQWNEQ